jgi:ADP-ribosylglycohydrolase
MVLIKTRRKQGSGMDKRNEKHFRGCMIGGAIGDALGWPVEFISYHEIIQRYGPEGIKTLDTRGKEKAEITDDTQMTIFTAEGILRAFTRGNEKGICHTPTAVYHAYIRWLYTQGVKSRGKESIVDNLDGWISGIKDLYAQRAPGRTCIQALKSGAMGDIEKPINNSKGCGGVMRVAPVGLILDEKKAFSLGCEVAAITHGHPSGYLSGGAFAHIIQAIISGMELEGAVLDTIEELSKYRDHHECLHLLQRALELSKENNPSTDKLSKLGQGWVGEEALAMAVYCALVYKDDFEKALILSVNHDGDSDSTGAITGNILGAYLGIDAIPKHWIEGIELKNELMELADDLLKGYDEDRKWSIKYPGW